MTIGILILVGLIWCFAVGPIVAHFVGKILLGWLKHEFLLWYWPDRFLEAVAAAAIVVASVAATYVIQHFWTVRI